MSGYEPGTVAVVTNKWVEPATRVLIESAAEGRRWWGKGGYVTDRDAETIRPLVVIDPDDAEQVERLMNGVLAIVSDRILPHGVRAVQAALREFANPTPPKPPEPQGLGAVVEDAEGKRFVRYTDELTAPWRHVEPPCGARPYRYYADISAVKVLSEGVPA